MRNHSYLTYGYAVIGDDDPALLGKAEGLIREGLVIVRSAHELSLSQRNEGAARVGVMLAELEREHERLQVEKRLTDESVAEVASRLQRRQGRTPDAQAIFDELTRQDRARDLSRSDPPKTVSKHDLKAIGRWADAIAKGLTRVI